MSIPGEWASAARSSSVRVFESEARAAMSSSTACWRSDQRFSRSASARAARSWTSVSAEMASSVTSSMSSIVQCRGSVSSTQKAPRTRPSGPISGTLRQATTLSRSPSAIGPSTRTSSMTNGDPLRMISSHSSPVTCSRAAASSSSSSVVQLAISCWPRDSKSAMRAVGARSALAAQRVSRSSAAAACASRSAWVAGGSPSFGPMLRCDSTFKVIGLFSPYLESLSAQT